MDLEYELRKVVLLVPNLGILWIFLISGRADSPLKMRLLYSYYALVDMVKFWDLGLEYLIIIKFGLGIWTEEGPLVDSKCWFLMDMLDINKEIFFSSSDTYELW